MQRFLGILKNFLALPRLPLVTQKLNLLETAIIRAYTIDKLFEERLRSLIFLEPEVSNFGRDRCELRYVLRD